MWYCVLNVFINLKQLIIDQFDRCRCKSTPQQSGSDSNFMLISNLVLYDEMQESSTIAIAVSEV